MATGIRLLQSGKPDQAEKIFSAIIASYEKDYDETVIFRCASDKTLDKAISDSFGAAQTSKRRNIVLGSEEWCTALWGKGLR